MLAMLLAVGAILFAHAHNYTEIQSGACNDMVHVKDKYTAIARGFKGS